MKIIAIAKNDKHFTLNMKLCGITLFDRKWSCDGRHLEVKIIGVPIYIPRRFLKGTIVQVWYEKYLHLKKCGVISRRRALTLRIEDIEKNLIANSGYWDALWYVNKYGHQNFTRQQALNYWYHVGWKKGEDPSPVFCVRNFVDFNGWQNPILSYLSKSNAIPRSVNNVHKLNVDDEIVATYWANHSRRKSKSVVYTCITGGYDDLREIPAHTYVNYDWDYVCFTDDKSLLIQKQFGIWQIRELAFVDRDNTRNGRWHKTHPHIILPEYDESVYVDGNINILSDFLFKQIRSIGLPIVIPRHQRNLCLFTEYRDVLNAELDDKNIIIEEETFVRANGMPSNYGSLETNIIYRRHNDPIVKRIMEQWWDMINKYSKRDQLSITYILWKNGVKIQDMTFENARLLHRDFLVFPHVHYIKD